MVRVTQRTVAVAVVLLAAIGWGGLTARRGARRTPKAAQAVEIDYSGADRLDAAVARGNGRHRVLPPGELRELPRDRRPRRQGRPGPDAQPRSTRTPRG